MPASLTPTPSAIQNGIKKIVAGEYDEGPPQAALPARCEAAVRPAYIVHELATTVQWTLPPEFAMVEQSQALMSLPQRILLWGLVYGLGPRRYLEIGTDAGGSAMIVASAVKALGDIDFSAVCIDPHFQIDDATRDYLGDRFHYLEQTNSPAAMIAAARLAGGRFDLVMIDGDHRYDYTLTDIMLAVPYLADGGYLLIDDAGHPQVRDAIRFAVGQLALTDCGLLCRHVIQASFLSAVAAGPWQGEVPRSGGLYLLHQPSGG